MSRKAPPPRRLRRYCLQCFVALQDHKVCARCDFVNHAHLQRAYWNRRRSLVRLEWLLKGALGGGVALALVALLLNAGRLAVGFMGLGFLLLMPMLVGAALWETISTLTHDHRYFQPSRMWIASLILGGLVFWLAAGMPRVLAGALLGAVLVYLLAALFRRWKRRLTTRWQFDGQAY